MTPRQPSSPSDESAVGKPVDDRLAKPAAAESSADPAIVGRAAQKAPATVPSVAIEEEEDRTAVYLRGPTVFTA
ncbi:MULTISPECIES: hypothetical protein [Microvirga]|uniref:hypothetical protein n=1 Tax=Microvirga TaxID=186650 RepID=UPI001CFC69DA|nr:hypothetical protein [Microvirga lenta]MCB5173756.1 hypothetical protein [Microvirga lenta]